MAIKTLISMTKKNGGLDNIVLEFEDATVEAVSEAAITLIQRNGFVEGDSIAATTINTEN